MPILDLPEDVVDAIQDRSARIKIFRYACEWDDRHRRWTGMGVCWEPMDTHAALVAGHARWRSEQVSAA